MDCDASMLEGTEDLRGLYEDSDTHPETLERLDSVILALVRETLLRQ